MVFRWLGGFKGGEKMKNSDKMYVAHRIARVDANRLNLTNRGEAMSTKGIIGFLPVFDSLENLQKAMPGVSHRIIVVKEEGLNDDTW